MAGARHFTELIVWQLADELRAATLTLTQRRRFARDLKLCSQTEDAANSVCRNIAEGFGGTNRQFANYLRIARRSMNELQDAFAGASAKGYVTHADLIPPRKLLKRLYPAIGRFIRHLDDHPYPPPPDAA